MYKILLFIFSIFCWASCGVEEGASSGKIQNMEVYLEKARIKTNAVEALKKVCKELSILTINQPTLSTIHYDTCLTADLVKHIEDLENAVFNINVLDLKYLDNFIENKKVAATEAKWSFLHSRDFDYLIPINELNDATNERATEALAYWYKIKDIRYTVVLLEQNKILPRTKYENYVLGGYFQGYGILYDLMNHKVICYFNLRINNSSNKIEDYNKNGQDVYEAMVAELKSETKRKIKLKLSQKLNMEEAAIEPGL